MQHSVTKHGYECFNKCGRVYRYKSNVYRHCKYECGNKTRQFKCDVCSSLFIQKVHLKTHMAMIHNRILL